MGVFTNPAICMASGKDCGCILRFFVGYLGLRMFRRKFSSVQDWPLLIPAVIWGLFAIWEWHCKAQQYNIRVDLLLFYPVLIIVSIAGPLLSFRKP